MMLIVCEFLVYLHMEGSKFVVGPTMCVP